MADEFVTAAKDMLPSVSGGDILTYVIIFLIIILAGVGLTILTIYLMNMIKFNKKISLFRKLGGVNTKVGEFRAMFSRIGKAGDYWCIIKKNKEDTATTKNPKRKKRILVL